MPPQPRVTKADSTLLDTFGFAIEEPPAKDITRRSKYDEMWEAARTICTKFPGKSIRIRDFNTASHAYNVAKDINNGENRNFADDFASWEAVAGKRTNDEGTEVVSLWLTYRGEPNGNGTED